MGYRARAVLPDLLDDDHGVQDRAAGLRSVAVLHADARQLPRGVRAQQLLCVRMEFGADLGGRDDRLPDSRRARRLRDGVLPESPHAENPAVDALDQDDAVGRRAGADLSAVEEHRPARQRERTRDRLHADQSADRGVDVVHLLQRDSARHSRSRTHGRRGHVAGNRLSADADVGARPRVHRAAADHSVVERSLLEHQPVEFERGAADGVHRVVFESGRAVLGQALGGFAAGGRAGADRRLALAEATGARPHVRRGQIIETEPQTS
ncbi:hypothetical protein PT2222_270112 [Paraburkholderia tropica]